MVNSLRPAMIISMPAQSAPKSDYSQRYVGSYSTPYLFKNASTSPLKSV